MGEMDFDRFIQRYTAERQCVPKQVALQHLLSHAYMVSSNDEVDLFFRRIRTDVLIHIESLSLFDNPLCNAQGCWLLFFPFGLAFSLFMTTYPELVLPGLIYCAATVIYGTSLLIMIIQQWLDNSIQIAYYREILDFIDSRQSS